MIGKSFEYQILEAIQVENIPKIPPQYVNQLFELQMQSKFRFVIVYFFTFI